MPDRLTPRRLSAVVAVVLATMNSATAGLLSDYQASSGLFPNQINPPYTLGNTATPEVPTLAGGVLTLSTSNGGENMYYIQSGPTVETSAAFFIEARVRYVSGSTINAARAPIFIGLTTAPGTGNGLFIDRDQVFFNTANVTAGLKASVDTDGGFHTYRIDYNGSGGLTLRYDGVQILTGSTFVDAGFNGTDDRVFWGEGSSLASGRSEWRFFRHNALVAPTAAVPEPASVAILGIGAAGLLGYGRRSGVRF